MIKDIGKWLKQSPKKSEIVEIQTGKVKDGKSEVVKIIPQKIIESLLDELTEQNWSTRNFQFSRWSEQGLPPVQTTDGRPVYNSGLNARTMCDASLELVVTYKMVVPVSPYEDAAAMGPVRQSVKEIEITRVLVGAVSFDVSFFGNDHIANTAKSLAISNAASDLGKRFGKDLNPKEASMMILGISRPLKLDTSSFGAEVKGKIGETLSKLKDDLSKKTIG